MNDNDRTSPGSDRQGNGHGQDVDPEMQPYVDAADRLERTLDAQLQTVRNIDSRAGFIIRVVAILLGVVVSVVSVLATLRMSGSGGLVVFPLIAVFTALIGGIGLVGAMMMAIITYLSSKQIPGLGHRTADVLSNPEYETDMEEHIRSTLAVYSYAVKVNGQIIQANSARLRMTLTLLVVGIVYGTLTSRFVLSGSGIVEWGALIIASVVLGIVVWYIHTERYIVEQPERGDINEHSE